MHTLLTETKPALEAILAHVPAPVGRGRMYATVYHTNDIFGSPCALRVRITHTRFNKLANAEINAYKKALVTALKAAGYLSFKVNGAGLRFMYCSSIGQPKDGLAWDIEARSALTLVPA